MKYDLSDKIRIKNIDNDEIYEYTLDQLFNCHELGMAIAFDKNFTFERHQEALKRFKSQLKQYIQTKIDQEVKKALDIPIGVSKWKEIGEKFGYYEYFRKEEVKKVLEEIIRLSG